MIETSCPGSRSCRDWAWGAVLAVTFGVYCLAIRAPLYDNDGYRYWLYAQVPLPYHNVHPHHLLWNHIQIALVKLGSLAGQTTTVTVQLFGILINSLTLAVFYRLLYRISNDAIFASIGILVIAFSPWFAYLGFQNQPYPLVFLAAVLYFSLWNTRDGLAPSGPRLFGAGCLLVLATLLQQAMVLFIPAAVVTLAFSERGIARRPTVRACAWGGCVAISILAVYLGFAEVLGARTPRAFVFFLTKFLNSQHPIQLDFPRSPVQAVIGISGSLVQTDAINESLQKHLSAVGIWAFYAMLGAIVCFAFGSLFRVKKTRRRFSDVFRNNALFRVSILSAGLWSAFVILWEPVTSYYWTLNLFPTLICAWLLLRERISRPVVWVLAVSVLCLSAWNGYSNYRYDRANMGHFPEPQLAAIRKGLGPNDIFIVPNRNWTPAVDYDLLFECLQYSLPKNPGVAIFDSGALDESLWRRRLADRIHTAWASGGRVFVAADVFDPESYDLDNSDDPFAKWIHRPYVGFNGLAQFERVKKFFSRYRMVHSNLKIGSERYFLIEGSAA